MRTARPRGWHVVLPVKSPAAGKTRLGGGERPQLALAFARDTMSAIAGCSAVAELVVVTTDDSVARAAAEHSATVVREQPAAPSNGLAGLNSAIEQGVREAGLGELPTAALTADLPALTADELAEALAACAQHPRAFVADHSGTGTSLLAAQRGRLLAPQFGDRSADAHRRSGAVLLGADLAGLRQDVDLPADLAAAQAIGIGVHTTEVLSRTDELRAQYSPENR